MANNVVSLARATIEEHNTRLSRREMINWKGFPDDVKVDYENRVAKVNLKWSDIFRRVNGK